MHSWVDNSESKEDKVSAVVPSEVDDVHLREIVLKYQIHSCRPGRCFKEDAKHTLCMQARIESVTSQKKLSN